MADEEIGEAPQLVKTQDDKDLFRDRMLGVIWGNLAEGEVPIEIVPPTSTFSAHWR